MASSEIISKLFEIYQKINSFKEISPGFGFYFQRFERGDRISFLLIVVEPPHYRIKSKQKDFEKVINKSLSSNKLILPKDFRVLTNYISAEFNKFITPRNEILNKLKHIIASLRLNIFEDNNMKYSIQSMFPEIIAYERINDKGQYAFYFNVVNLNEDGLILAHERQLNFLYEQIENGINPINILDADLPNLRSGDTAFSFSKAQNRNSSAENKKSVKKFRQLINQKKSKEAISNELDYETVIDFNPSAKNINIEENKAEKPTVRRGLFGQPIGKMPVKKTSPVSKPQPLENTETIPDFPPSNSLSPFAEEQTVITKQSKNAEIEELEKKIEDLERQNQELLQIKESNDLLSNQIIQITDELTSKLEQKDNELDKIKKEFEQLKINLEKEQKKTKDLEEEIQRLEREKNLAIDEIQEQIQDLMEENATLLKAYDENELKREELELKMEEITNSKNVIEEKYKSIINALKEEIQILNKKINKDIA